MPAALPRRSQGCGTRGSLCRLVLGPDLGPLSAGLSTARPCAVISATNSHQQAREGRTPLIGRKGHAARRKIVDGCAHVLGIAGTSTSFAAAGPVRFVRLGLMMPLVDDLASIRPSSPLSGYTTRLQICGQPALNGRTSATVQQSANLQRMTLVGSVRSGA